MPNVVNQPIDQVLKQLTDLKLKVDQTREASETDRRRPRHQHQSSCTGKTREGARVTVVVSDGFPKVEMPDVVNLTQDAATSVLTGKGLLVAVELQTLPPDDGRVGKVLTQSQPAGQQVRKGSTIRLTVGRAPRDHDHHDDDDHHDHYDAADDHHQVAAVQCGSHQGEEVAQHVVTAGRQDRFGMELHAFDGVLTMTQTHHEPVVGRGRDLETIGHRVAGHDQRVVARRLERIGQAGEHPSPVVADQRGLAVHHLRSAYDAAAEDLPHALQTEAHAEDRDAVPRGA